MKLFNLARHFFERSSWYFLKSITHFSRYWWHFVKIKATFQDWLNFLNFFALPKLFHYQNHLYQDFAFTFPSTFLFFRPRLLFWLTFADPSKIRKRSTLPLYQKIKITFYQKRSTPTLYKNRGKQSHFTKN